MHDPLQAGAAAVFTLWHGIKEDGNLQQLALGDPPAALASLGGSVPDGFEIVYSQDGAEHHFRLSDASGHTRTFVCTQDGTFRIEGEAPPADESDELSMEELEAVAGGSVRNAMLKCYGQYAASWQAVNICGSFGYDSSQPCQAWYIPSGQGYIVPCDTAG